MAITTFKLNTIEKLQAGIREGKAKKNFASRKTHTKSYAKEHNLYLPAGEVSWNNDNIDWHEAIKQKYNTDFETWSDIYWSSKPKSTRNLKAMSDDEAKEYKRIASRKSRMKSQLELCDVSIDQFLAHIEVTADEFFSDKYQADNKVKEGNSVSIYNLEYYINNGQLASLLE